MRDITYRPVHSEHTPPVVQKPVTLPPVPPLTSPSRFSQFLHWLNLVGGKTMALLGAAPQEVKELSIRVSIHKGTIPKTRLVSAPKVSHRLRRGSKIVFEKTKQTASKHGRQLKTPVGKVAAVNMIALIALFTYVQTQQRITTSEAARNAATSLNQPLQRFLPVVPNTIQNTAFDEQQVTKTPHHTQLHVWVTPWNMAEVEATRASYASFSAFWATVGEDGSTISTKDNLANWKAFAEKNSNGQPTFLTITGNPDYTSLMLTSSAVQQSFMTNALNLAKTYNFTGIDLDFEGLGSTNSDLFSSFTRNFATILHGEGKELSLTLEARIANQVPMDWHTLGLIADEVRIMTYDYHSRLTNQPGPIAPLGWVKEVVDYAVGTIDPKKVIVGLGNYGYDWQAPETAEESWSGTGLSYERAQSLAQESNTPLLHSTGIDQRGYDIGTTPYFHYRDSAGKDHEVWYEDAASLQEKVDLVDQYPLKGIIFWSVGLGDQTFWTQQNTLSYTK
jgi:spore germination protein